MDNFKDLTSKDMCDIENALMFIRNNAPIVEQYVENYLSKVKGSNKYKDYRRISYLKLACKKEGLFYEKY